MSQSPPALSGPGPRQDAQDIATRTAESVAHAWHCQHLGERSQVPLGIVATLAQVRHPHSATDPAEHLRGLTTETLWRTLEGVWRRQWLLRPELVHWARALHSWLQEETLSRELGDAVQAVTYAALDAGLLSLTGAPDPMRRSAADVLAPLLGLLRSGGAREGLGEHHTPGDVAALFSSLLVPQPAERGAWFYDPAAGTGGLLRERAQQLRHQGDAPHHYCWFAQEVDTLAAACCAANMLVWDLGSTALVHCGDTLTAPQGAEAALAERRALWARRDQVHTAASLAVATHSAAQLLGFPPPFLHRPASSEEP